MRFKESLQENMRRCVQSKIYAVFRGIIYIEVTGSAIDGEVLTGKFQVTPASEENHGPIRVANTYHFAYEDRTPYYSIGTTCYVWAERGFRCCSQKVFCP